MRRVFLLFPLFCLIALILWGCATPQPGVVAKVGKYNITDEDLNKAMGRARFKTFDEELEARKKRVETLAQDRLMLLAAYDEKLDTLPELKQHIESGKKNMILNALYKVEIEAKAGDISDKEIEGIHNRLKETLHARHILVKDEALADSIYKLLQGGADFAELAMQYSEDRSNKSKGGDLGEFSAMTMVQEFEDAVYALSPGETSKPIKTQYGFHIINLLEKKPNPKVKPIEQEKNRILQTLKRKKQAELAQKFIEDLFDGAGLEFYDNAVKTIIDVYSALEKEAEPAAPPTFTPEQRQMVVAKYNEGTMTIAQFDSSFQKLPPFRRQKLDGPDAVKQFVKRSIQGPLLEKKADELKITETEEYKALYNESIERRMVDEFRKNVLYKEIDPDDEQVKAYYDANPDSFMEGEQVKVTEIQVNTEDEAKKLIDRINKGEDIGKLATEFTQRSYTQKKNGDLGFFTERRYPELFKAAKTIKPGELYPNPIPFQKKFSVIKLVEVKKPEIKPFDSVKRIIKNKLRTKMRDEALDTWMEQAKSKYGFHIYEQEIEKTIDKSKYEQEEPPA